MAAFDDETGEALNDAARAVVAEATTAVSSTAKETAPNPTSSSKLDSIATVDIAEGALVAGAGRRRALKHADTQENGSMCRSR